MSPRQARPAAPSKEPAVKPAQPGSVNILMVDDHRENLLALEGILRVPEYNLVSANSGREALKQLLDRDFALILLDVKMPEVDGWEMLRRVQQRHGVGAIPVVMFSGKVNEQSAAEATALGAQGFVGKPFDPQQLIEQAKQLLPA